MVKKSWRYCVNNCNSSRYNKKKGVDDGITFHSLPKKNLELKGKWIVFCKKNSDFDWSGSVVCSKHFPVTAFQRDLRNELLNLPQKRILKDDAFPCIYDEKDLIKVNKDNIREKRRESREIRKQILDLLDGKEPEAPTIISKVKSRENEKNQRLNKTEHKILTCVSCQCKFQVDINMQDELGHTSADEALCLFFVNVFSLEEKISLRSIGILPFCTKCRATIEQLKETSDALQLLNLKYKLQKENLEKSLINAFLKQKNFPREDNLIENIITKWETSLSQKSRNDVEEVCKTVADRGKIYCRLCENVFQDSSFDAHLTSGETEVKYEIESLIDVAYDDVSELEMKLSVSEPEEEYFVVVDSYDDFDDHDSLTPTQHETFDNKKPIKRRINRSSTLLKKSKEKRPKSSSLKVTCKTCGKSMQSQCLKGHMNKHTGERPFVCIDCSHSFGTKTLMNKHRARMHGVKKRRGVLDMNLANEFAARGRLYFCDMCCWSYNHKYRFLRHLKITHAEDVKDEEKFLFYYCDGNNCFSSFSSLSKLHEHIKTIHYKENGHNFPPGKSESSSGSPFECNFCQRLFCLPQNMESHQKSHKGAFPCQYCHQVLDSETDLSTHIPRHEIIYDADIYCHLCDECGQSFAKIYHLKKHKKETHSNNAGKKYSSESATFQFRPPKSFKNFTPCSVCGRQTLKTHMKNHMARHKLPYLVNSTKKRCDSLEAEGRKGEKEKGIEKTTEIKESDIKKVKCPYCPRKMGSGATKAYRKHLVLRHGEEYLTSHPHYCRFCYMTFLTTEEKSQHVDDAHYHYKCTMDGCNRKFLCVSKRQDHLNVHMNLKPHVCPVCPKGFANETNLCSHIIVKHLFHRSHLCQLCPSNPGYYTKRDLRKHSVENHPGVLFENIHLYNKPPKDIQIQAQFSLNQS